MVATLHIDGETLLGIVCRLSDVTHAHIDTTKDIQTSCTIVIAIAEQRQRLLAIPGSLLILLLVVQPLGSPVPNLLAQGILWCSILKLDGLHSELFHVQCLKELIGILHRHILVEVCQSLLHRSCCHTHRTAQQDYRPHPSHYSYYSHNSHQISTQTSFPPGTPLTAMSEVSGLQGLV